MTTPSDPVEPRELYEVKTTWSRATPEEMVRELQKKLDRTPKWKILKRLGLKRSIELWQYNVEGEQS